MRTDIDWDQLILRQNISSLELGVYRRRVRKMEDEMHSLSNRFQWLTVIIIFMVYVCIYTLYLTVTPLEEWPKELAKRRQRS